MPAGSPGALAGTCEAQGYVVSCVPCESSQAIFVRGAGVCDQEHTRCYYEAAGETCADVATCPF